MNAVTEVYLCAVCGGSAGELVETTERMFGMGGVFCYFECKSCGCVQLKNVPDNLGLYYPAAKYYSLAASYLGPRTRVSRPNLLVRLRNEYLLFGKPIGAAPLTWLRPWPDGAKGIEPFFRHCKVRSLDCRVLDVGCGKGDLLCRLASFGFSHLRGVDPFLSDTTSPGDGIELSNCHVSSLDKGKFDLIISHHSLEHVPDQEQVLRAIATRLSPHGVCRIEIPVAGSRAWHEFGPFWAELDPPRHLYLHTRRSMELLAARSGLQISCIENVGTPIEFWVSELYRKGKSYYDETKMTLRHASDEFSVDEVKLFEQRSDQSNADGSCGRLAFWLEPAPL